GHAPDVAELSRVGRPCDHLAGRVAGAERCERAQQATPHALDRGNRPRCVPHRAYQSARTALAGAWRMAWRATAAAVAAAMPTRASAPAASRPSGQVMSMRQWNETGLTSKTR